MRRFESHSPNQTSNEELYPTNVSELIAVRQEGAKSMKRKNAIATFLRLIGAVIFGMCLYEDLGTFVWFIVGCVLTSIIIPHVITAIIFDDSYDGTFLIDESDPTDVKFKLIFETEPEILAKSKEFMVRVDHREANMDSDGGDING